MLKRIEETEHDFHEHDPRDAQIRRRHIFNPCCCMNLAAGTMCVGIAEIIVGMIDIGLTHILETNTKYGSNKIDKFYPVKPVYSSSTFITAMDRYGCSGFSIAMGLLLIVASKWASYTATIVMCSFWLVSRGICTLIQAILAGELMAAPTDYLETRGYELGTIVLLQMYFFVIVVFYTLSTCEDLKDMRAIAPFHGAIDLEDDELHLQDISRMHAQENDMDENISRRDEYVHMDVSEFRLQVAESRSSRMIQISGPPEKKKNSYNIEEYHAYLGYKKR